MREYKLNKDKKNQIPSDETINKYKSFDKIRTSYSDVVKPSRVPLYKNKKLFLFLLLVAIAAWYLSTVDEDGKKDKDVDNIEVAP